MNKADLEELEAGFVEAEMSSDGSVHLKFTQRLLSANDDERIGYHFDLLRRARNSQLHYVLARFFDQRGEAGRKYLLARLANEADPVSLATALQKLGAWTGGSKGEEAAVLARACLHHDAAIVRERACVVLGWVGSPNDVSLLRTLELEDTDINTRKWAATQQMHIWFRFPEVKDEVIRNLDSAMRTESEPEVFEMIVYTAQKVLKRYFGLKEDRDKRRMVGRPG